MNNKEQMGMYSPSVASVSTYSTTEGTTDYDPDWGTTEYPGGYYPPYTPPMGGDGPTTDPDSGATTFLRKSEPHTV